MTQAWFITGTDTGAGKTVAACALAFRLRELGRRVAPMKPIAAGGHQTPQGFRNEDAEALIAACGGGFDYGRVNPVALEDPTAPAIAAEREGRSIDLWSLEAAFRTLAEDADCVIVEGVGGWEAPLGSYLSQAALCKRLRLPAILVVGLRLGCLSHARLSARAIEADGIRLAGWIGSSLSAEMPYLDENLALLDRLLPAPCLGVMPFLPEATNAERGAFLSAPADG